MLVVHLSTYDIQGGAARAAWRLHNGLRRLGCESVMLTKFKATVDLDVHQVSNEPDERTTTILAHWAALTETYINQNRTPLTDCLFTLPVPGFDLIRHPLVLAADVLHFHWVSGMLSPSAIAALQNLGKPLVWTLHDQRAFTGGCHFSFGCAKFESDCAHCPQLGEKALNLTEGVLSEALQLIDPSKIAVTAPSRWMAICASRSAMFRRSPLSIIPYGLDTAVFKPIKKGAAREELNLSQEGLYFLFGADTLQDKRKGSRVLEEALLLCQKDVSFCAEVGSGRINLICYGWGSQDVKLFAGLPVRGLGHLEAETDMALLHSAADVYVCPTIEDNLPNTIIEALSCGTPVLASDVGGVPDLVTSHLNGLLFERSNASDLAAAILWIVENRAVLPLWSIQAREKIIADHTLELQAARFVDLYSGYVDSVQPPSSLSQATIQTAPLLPSTWEIPTAGDRKLLG